MDLLLEANICSDLLQAHFRSKCLGANSEFCGARNLLSRYHWTTLVKEVHDRILKYNEPIMSLTGS